MFVSVAETGGDVEEQIFKYSNENKLLYDDARIEMRENTMFTSKALEPFNYNNRMVREKELYRARLWMTKYNVSEHSARDELKLRVNVKSSEDLEKKKEEIPFTNKLDLILAIDGAHQRLLMMNQPAMVEDNV